MDNTFFRFDKLEASLQQEIWSSKEWTWAVFLREPAERLLSAYLDKIAKATTQNKIFNGLGINATSAVFTFEDFVQRLAMDFNETGCKTKQRATDTPELLTGMTGLNWCSDPREFSVSSWRLADLFLNQISHHHNCSIKTGGLKSCRVDCTLISIDFSLLVI